MATKRTTTYLLSHNDDMNTMIKKINSAFRNINQDVTVTNITKSSVKTHHELPDTSTSDCHPIEAITNLATMLSNIGVDISEISEKIEEIQTNINDINTILTDYGEVLEDHEERIEALEA